MNSGPLSTLMRLGSPLSRENCSSTSTTLSADYYPIRVDPQLIAMGALVYHTPLGPVSFSGNYYQKQEQPWSFLFHIGYILFNRRGLD
jgi:hypothetical protein